MIKGLRIVLVSLSLLLVSTFAVYADNHGNMPETMQSVAETNEEEDGLNVQKILFGHILDSYSWEICKVGEKEIALHLPVILYSKTSGWHIFSSKKLGHGGGYDGFYPAPAGDPHEGKLMEKMEDGSFVRPLDLSLTKTAFAIIINSILLLLIFLPAAKWFRMHKDGSGVPGKYATFIEFAVMSVEDSVIKPCVGENYKKFSPYLLTAFFFIFLCNILALIPILPFGVGVTANVTITMALALCTFLVVNIFGTKEYWKEIFWPDVPLMLKAPLPIIPLIEFFGLLTKPIALMIRLFANMLSGHMAILVLTILIFIGFNTSVVMGSSLTLISVLFNVFMNMLELLVAFIQAYVFTLLSSIFIGLAQVKHH